MGCAGCFNEHIKNQDIIINTDEEIIQIITNNPFNKGIILGGLEWTLQVDEAETLINRALLVGLEVMLYTGLTEDKFSKKIKRLYQLPIYIKFGQYDESRKSDKYYSHGVKLISSNQYIKKCGGIN